MFCRYAIAITSGTFITLALFFAMQSLIAMDTFDPVEPIPSGTLTFTRLIDEKPVIPEDFTRFETLLDPTEPPPPRPGPDKGDNTISFEYADPRPPPPTRLKGLTGFLHDGPLVVMVRVEPAYPHRALEQELEGFVTVQFDVAPDGTVSNISVVDSSHSIFERAAIRATRKFRFKARVVNGTAEATRGVRSRFVFRMNNG